MGGTPRNGFGIELAMNNHSLSYLDDDVQLPVLTPNAMLHIQSSYVPELEKHNIRGRELNNCQGTNVRCGTGGPENTRVAFGSNTELWDETNPAPQRWRSETLTRIRKLEIL